jgi:single-strand DNA-binding protein
MNKCFITGRIANNLELRSTSTGKSICEFRLATNRLTNRDGEKVADFINCRVWGKTAENLVKYQTKGNLIAVSGRMQVDIYQDKEGKNRYNNYLLVEELEFLEKKKEEDNEFKDLKTKTEVQDQFEYTDEDLPF